MTMRKTSLFELQDYQLEALRWRAEDSERLQTIALLGAWGSSKTTIAACWAAATCAENPWTELYGDEDPIFLCLGPCLRVVAAHRYLRPRVGRQYTAQSGSGRACRAL